jgi:DNA-binding transcriptional MerR regulator
MTIGELARRAGVSTDTVRFYERSGWLPASRRGDNRYRMYGEADAEHLQLLVDLRRLDIPLEDAARVASWCHSGHCADATDALPALIAERRRTVRERIDGLHQLDTRLAQLERHLSRQRLDVIDPAGACCEAARHVSNEGSAGCGCCTP